MSLQTSIKNDLGSAISSKAAEVESLGEPLTRAQALGVGVVQQLLDLQARINATGGGQGTQGFLGQGGNAQ